jgi:hypothetical protein
MGECANLRGTELELLGRRKRRFLRIAYGHGLVPGRGWSVVNTLYRFDLRLAGLHSDTILFAVG